MMLGVPHPLEHLCASSVCVFDVAVKLFRHPVVSADVAAPRRENVVHYPLCVSFCGRFT